MCVSEGSTVRIVYPLFLILLRSVSYTLVRNPSLVKRVPLRATQYLPHRTTKIDTVID